MVLRRWDPFNELKRMDDTFGRLWHTTHYRPNAASGEVATYSLPLDVTRDDTEVVIRASVPDVDPKDIEVTVDDGVLTIAGSSASERDGESEGYVLRERRSGRFARSVRLPDYVDADRAESSYEHGVISVTLPKSEAAQSKRLEIKISSN
jgi:HSP20 family protein